ncbi:hypothetical protein HZS_4190 [Henneguya salminicola]|nr:hypothetical protein HZS_4190 [Henneguya salminicola]
MHRICNSRFERDEYKKALTSRSRKSVGNDIITPIMEAYNRGSGYQKIAEVFDHNRTTVHSVIKRYLRTGKIENKARRTRTQKI